MSLIRYLFVGDSVTDCGRREDAEHLGDGYVRLIADALTGAGDGATPRPVDVINTGVSGDRVRDLRARWTADCLALDPDVLTVLVGINDTWRRYDDDDETSARSFAADYRAVLDVTRIELPHTRIVLMEPFVLPVTADQGGWREDLDPKIAVVRGLAAEYGATLVPLDALLARVVANGTDPRALAADGVHPTPAGHRLIAQAWLEALNVPATP